MQIKNSKKNNNKAFFSYLTGFILSIILTIIPYLMISQHYLLEYQANVFIVVLFAILQLIVQLTFFLHLSAKPEQRWNLFTFVFTTVVLSILVSGTLWIMWSMNYNMMSNI